MTREAADAIAALRVNTAFYTAMASGDLTEMDAVWARDEPVLCIHPGGAPLQGRVAVMASWNEIFERGGPPIVHSQDSVSLIRGIAFVNCLEHIGDTTLSASNILVWESSAWRMVQHTAGVLTEIQSAANRPSGPLH